MCCPVTTPPDHHHQNTHKRGGHKVSWLKDPSKNEQKHSRESWPGLRQNPEPYSYLCLHQGLWRRSILTARARQSLPVSAQNVWMPASVRWETCNLQSSKTQPCLHVWSVIHRRPSKICTPELPPRGSRRFLDLTVTRPAFHHFTIPPLAGASKLIPLTPTTTLWRIMGGSLVMVYIKMYPDLKGDQILIIPAPVFQCYSEGMYRDLTLPAASPTSQWGVANQSLAPTKSSEARAQDQRVKNCPPWREDIQVCVCGVEWGVSRGPAIGGIVSKINVYLLIENIYLAIFSMIFCPNLWDLRPINLIPWLYVKNNKSFFKQLYVKQLYIQKYLWDSRP